MHSHITTHFNEIIHVMALSVSFVVVNTVFKKAGYRSCYLPGFVEIRTRNSGIGVGIPRQHCPGKGILDERCLKNSLQNS